MDKHYNKCANQGCIQVFFFCYIILIVIYYTEPRVCGIANVMLGTLVSHVCCTPTTNMYFKAVFYCV